MAPTKSSGKSSGPDTRQIVTAYLGLLAEGPLEEATLGRLAARAEISLGDLRARFSGRAALIAAFAAMIDEEVLAERDPDMAGQPAHDRLFDVLMTRLDKLEPYKEGIRSLMAGLRRDPALALEVNCIAVRSQAWMLTAAGISLPGLRGSLVTQGLAVSFAKVVATWLAEEDPGMPRTMAKLDRELDRGEDWLKRLDKAEVLAGRLGRLACRLRKAGRRMSSKRRPRWAEETDLGTGVPGDDAVAGA